MFLRLSVGSVVDLAEIPSSSGNGRGSSNGLTLLHGHVGVSYSTYCLDEENDQNQNWKEEFRCLVFGNGY